MPCVHVARQRAEGEEHQDAVNHHEDGKHSLCSPKSGNAAANEDRAKLLAANALAAYSG